MNDRTTKQLVVIISLALCAAAWLGHDRGARAAVLAGPTQQGIVSAWDFEDGPGSTQAQDPVNGNHAVLTNMNTATAWVPGRIGMALDFDGTDDEAIISGISQLNGASEMTIAMWVRSEGNGNNEGLLQHRTPGNLNANHHGLNTPLTETDRVQFRIKNNPVDANGVLADNEWTHIVATWKSNDFRRIYVNGELVSQNSDNNGAIVSDSAWRFANDICCGNRFFDGQIDDAAVWNRAISPGDVATIYGSALRGQSVQNAGNFPLQQGLVGHWTFDDHSGSSLAEDRAGGNHATLQNSSTSISGQVGGALDFNGVDSASGDQGLVGNIAALDGAQALTMSVWVQSNGNNGNEGVFTHRYANESSSDPIVLHGLNTPSSLTNGIQFRIENNHINSDSNALALDGSWTHVVGVWESGSRMELWIDGELATTHNTPPTLLSGLDAGGVWRFGYDKASCCGNDRHFDGGLDDAGLWNRALSPHEIALIYQEGLQGFNLATIVPEPSTWVMGFVGAAGVCLLFRRRRG